MSQYILYVNFYKALLNFVLGFLFIIIILSLEECCSFSEQSQSYKVPHKRL